MKDNVTTVGRNIISLDHVEDQYTTVSQRIGQKAEERATGVAEAIQVRGQHPESTTHHPVETIGAVKTLTT